jgi:hypothetical protein
MRHNRGVHATFLSGAIVQPAALIFRHDATAEPRIACEVRMPAPRRDRLRRRRIDRRPWLFSRFVHAGSPRPFERQDAIDFHGYW